MIRNVKIGVLLCSDAYYNVIEDAIIDAKVECFEIIDGANENIIRGGRCQSASSPARSGVGLWVRNADDVKVFGTSFENLDIGIKLDDGAVGTVIIAPRLENMNCGIRLLKGSRKTAIFSTYQSNLTTGICKDIGVIKDIHYRYYGF